MAITLPIILLAAGQSARMKGRDKLMEEVSGQPLIRRQAILARAVTDGPVIVALPPPPHPRYDALEGLEVLCLPVAAAAEGMGASLRTAFAALPPDTDQAMLLLGDLPDLTEADLRMVAEAALAEDGPLGWRGATEEGAPGHPIVFHRDLFAEMRQLAGDDGGRDVVAQAGDRVRLIRLPGKRALADLDTPEDWDAWRKATKS